MNMWRKVAQRLRALNRDQEQLNKMVAELHACRTLEEVTQIIAEFVPFLFPLVSGELYMPMDDQNSAWKREKGWGNSPQSKRTFSLEQCRALKCMKPHLVENPKLACGHVILGPSESSICLPLMGDAQALGVLHLQSPDRVLVLKKKLAEKMASHVAQVLGKLRLQERLSDQAVRDPLTRLFNRRYMEESLRRELAIRVKRPVGVIMLDIDHFKKFNTVFTHSGGDDLLKTFGNFLQNHVRGADVACRFGGEEFVLILPGASVEVTRQRAENLRKEVKKLEVDHHGQILGKITLSLGVAASGTHGCAGEEILDAAIIALGQAKKKGRDRVIVAPFNLQDGSVRRRYAPKHNSHGARPKRKKATP